MKTSDRIISNLINALDIIGREADKATASRYFIAGVVRKAIDDCNAERERNSDGYLVVKESR